MSKYVPKSESSSPTSKAWPFFYIRHKILPPLVKAALIESIILGSYEEGPQGECVRHILTNLIQGPFSQAILALCTLLKKYLNVCSTLTIH